MDLEGRDVDILYPGPYLQYVIGLQDVTLTEGVWRAYHNYLKSYCSVDPKRLKSAAMVPGNDVKWAVEEKLADPTVVVADTTAQEATIPYPNEMRLTISFSRFTIVWILVGHALDQVDDLIEIDL